MKFNAKYWIRFTLITIGAGAAGYQAGGWSSAVVAACSAGGSLLHPSPTDPRVVNEE